MADPAHTTCWTMIHAAADGEAAERDEFARRYEPVIRAYLSIRWRRGPLIAELDDGVQEVFVECYRKGGVLQRAEPDRPGGFRAFLYGVTRNVALRVESRRARRGEKQPATDFMEALPETNDDAPSRAFDRAWARSVMRDAAARQGAKGILLITCGPRTSCTLETGIPNSWSKIVIVTNSPLSPSPIVPMLSLASEEFILLMLHLAPLKGFHSGS